LNHKAVQAGLQLIAHDATRAPETAGFYFRLNVRRIRSASESSFKRFEKDPPAQAQAVYSFTGNCSAFLRPY
jgi:hypothetical protein